MSESVPRPAALPTEALQPNLSRILETTPARLFRGRSGLGYHTRTQLELRADHAAARDAVQTEIVITRDFSRDFIAGSGMIETTTQAESRRQFLVRPDLGRRLNEAARDAIRRSCGSGLDVQIVVGDGLSSAAVVQQVPELLSRLESLIADRGWQTGPAIFVHRCRVGVMNDIGELISPRVVVLLIGERPGLACAESMSAYLAYAPREGDNDSRRNLISNIHRRGISTESAATRIVGLIDRMLSRKTSGCDLKEEASAVFGSPGVIRNPSRLTAQP